MSLNPQASACDWVGQTNAERIHLCRVMLALHGLLSDAENNRVKRRQMRRGLVPPEAIIDPNPSRKEPANGL